MGEHFKYTIGMLHSIGYNFHLCRLLQQITKQLNKTKQSDVFFNKNVNFEVSSSSATMFLVMFDELRKPSAKYS